MPNLLCLFSLLLISLPLRHQASVSTLLQPLLDDGNIDWDFCYPISSNFLITWKFVPENDSISLGVTSVSTGFVGIGFNQDPMMINTDAAISRFVDGKPQVDDYFLQDQAECFRGSGVCVDSSFSGGKNNAPGLLVAGRNETTTWFAFNRFRVAQDSYDVTIPKNGKINLIWSFGYTDDVQQHDPNARGTINFNFGDPGLDCSEFDDCSGHGKCAGACCICDEGWGGDDCSSGGGSDPTPDPFIYDDNDTLIDPSMYEFSAELKSDFKIYWNILYEPTKDSNTTGKPYLDMGFHYTGSDSGWMGLGFGKHMDDADAIVCTFGQTASIGDWTFRDRDTEGTLLDVSMVQDSGLPGRDNILAWTYGIQDGIQCRFRRYLDTKDSLDTIISDEKISCIWAYRDDPEWEEHTFRDRGRVKINFFTGDIERETNYWPIHGILMFLSWGAFVPLASLLARNFKWIGHPWFEIHRAVQIVSVFMSTAAFALAIVMVDRDDAAHFHGSHQIIGIVIFIIGGLQPFLGQLADFMFDPQREGVPIFPDRIHSLLGWGAIVLSVANIFLGIKIYESSSTVLILYSIWVAILFATIFIVQGVDKMGGFPKKE